VTHCLRLFIVCLQIDPKALEGEPTLRQILRKYELYEQAFPQNAALFKALRGEVHFFRHASKGCHIHKIYREEDMPALQQSCNQCGKKRPDLKQCSRCIKAWYCDRDCQKNHYPSHKLNCVAPKK
jgi:hypothetical protein